MIAVISPALNMRPCAAPLPLTTPRFQVQATELAALLARYAPYELEGLLRLQPGLAERAFFYYQDFAAESRPAAALLSFQGLAYQHICAADFTPEDWAFAQEHLAIGSALYGLLRPLDALKPYRLDFMGRFLPAGQTLYRYWGGQVAASLYQPGRTVVDLCSEEYSKLFVPYCGGERLVRCRFRLRRRGRYVCPATEAKMARGEMVRFLIKRRLTQPAQLREFCWQGYTYEEKISTAREFIFLKD